MWTTPGKEEQEWERDWCGGGGGAFYFLLSNMSVYILLQINFAINNKSLPSFTIQFQFQFSTRHFLTEVGSQGWKGVQKAVMFSLQPGIEERGFGSWESPAKATPRSVSLPSPHS